MDARSARFAGRGWWRDLAFGFFMQIDQRYDHIHRLKERIDCIAARQYALGAAGGAGHGRRVVVGGDGRDGRRVDDQQGISCRSIHVV